ncbi:hypothetical protein PVAND_008042 [Polypedilum vanderplanki]|uniref:Uncharacterized protein n=1 Tax=Polypedilum vanderplanki TaxID=319348 RepID=A0A9J6C904_POLVA|nr:hypothetical protein PVAND_008042 [Polypedilum vanderplanki]
MDCYSEYKYNHYQQQHNIHHTYYNNNPSMRFGNTTNDNHHTQQQQPQFYDGFSRHHSHPHLHQPTLSPYNNQQHPHHLHHPSSAAASYPSSPFDANNESSSQFYYSSMHQTATAVSSSYYGNHLSNHHHHQNPYETYRSAPSNYRSYNYGYHNNLHYPPHFQGHFYPQYNGNHAPAPADHFNHYPVTPPSSTTNGTIPSVRVTSSQHQQQQEDFNAPSSSATATNLHSNEFSSTSMKNDLHEEQGSNKSIENETKQQQQDVVNEEEERVEQSQDIENNKNNDSEIKEIKSSPMSVMNEENSNVENEKIKESTNNNDNDNNNNNNNSTNRSVEEEQEVAKKLKNESSYNETENFKENHEDTSATGYTSEVNSRTNKNHRDNEKQGATAHIGNDSRLPEHSNLTIANANSTNVIQNEYLFGLKQIQEHLNLSLNVLTKTEQNFAMNITNLLILYGESWIRLTNELFERDGFIVDIKSLYKFTSNIKARIKFDISRSIKEFSSGKITYMNKKLYQNFLSNLFGILDQFIERIKMGVNYNNELIECWDYYKTIFLEIGFDATNSLSKSSFDEIERLYNSFNLVKEKILTEIKYTKHILFYEFPSPLDNRLIINLYIQKNQRKILNAIDENFYLITSALQQIQNNVRAKLEMILQNATTKFDETFKEVIGCFEDINQGM